MEKIKDVRTKIVLFFIIIFIIIIITCAFTIYNIGKKNTTTNVLNQIATNNISTEQNIYVNTNIENIVDKTYENVPIEEASYDNKLIHVKKQSDYFTIKSLLEKYINMLKNKDKSYVYNILSSKYIENYNITQNNVISVHELPELENQLQYYKINIDEILTTQINEEIHIYIVKANCRIVGKNEIFKINIMYEVDKVKKIYNIYPHKYLQDNGYENLKAGNIINYQLEEIFDRQKNRFDYVFKSDMELAEEYFENYKELLKYYEDEAYKKLNMEYSNKRFGDRESFSVYIQENRRAIDSMNMSRYKVNRYNDYTDYICIDNNNNNIYIFRQKDGICEYEIFLDYYTVFTEEEEKSYSELDEDERAEYNLSKFISMVNTKDYNAIYDVLDNTFKENNFNNVEELKKYINNNFYDTNIAELEEYVDSDKYHVFKCTIKNSRNKEEIKNLDVIIDQSEGTDFTMSFSFD